MHKNLYYAIYLHILQHVSASPTKEPLVLFNWNSSQSTTGYRKLEAIMNINESPLNEF